MAKQHHQLDEKLSAFIRQQKIFFVGTAVADGRVNVSPKGADAFRVLGPNRAVWLNLTGSGNETSAHVQNNPRMTVMFCAFEGDPLILRLYGKARVIHKNEPEWPDLISHFPTIPGERQLFDLSIEMVQTSCGMAVPYFDYVSDREQLINWADKKGESGIREYWEEKNQVSIDGIPTHIIKTNG